MHVASHALRMLENELLREMGSAVVLTRVTHRYPTKRHESTCLPSCGKARIECSLAGSNARGCRYCPEYRLLYSNPPMIDQGREQGHGNGRGARRGFVLIHCINSQQALVKSARWFVLYMRTINRKDSSQNSACKARHRAWVCNNANIFVPWPEKPRFITLAPRATWEPSALTAPALTAERNPEPFHSASSLTNAR